MNKEEIVNLFKQFTKLAIETNADNVNLTTYTAKVVMEYIDELQKDNKTKVNINDAQCSEFIEKNYISRNLVKDKIARLEAKLKFYNKDVDKYEYFWNLDLIRELKDLVGDDYNV